MADPIQSDTAALEHELERSRPVPRAAFRGDLRRQLLASATVSRPRGLARLIAVYAGSGALLLVVAAAGVAGLGPLAA